MPLKHLIAVVIIAGFAVRGCSGPTTPAPEPEPSGPAAAISLDSVTTGPGVVHVPLRLTYTLGGKERLDSLDSFQIMVAYDTSVLAFKDEMERGQSISGWDNFLAHGNHRLKGADRTLMGVRIYASRFYYNDRYNEVERAQGLPEGVLTTLVFEVTADSSYDGSVFPLGFKGSYCGDNALVAQHRDDQFRYYMADARLGGPSAEAAFDTMDCSRRYSLEPVLEFREGAVQIEIPEPPEVSPLATIISVGSVSAAPGAEFELPITIRYPDSSSHGRVAFGGLHLQIVHDPSVLLLQDVAAGDALTPWEYFTWRNVILPPCDECPHSAVRIVSIADMNNGITPHPSTFYPDGTLATLRFCTFGDSTISNSPYDVGFLTRACEDNVMSSMDGNTLYFADPEYAEGDHRAIQPDTCTARPDYGMEKSLGFRSGRVYIGAP